MQREGKGKGWAKGVAKAAYGAVYTEVVREHGAFVDARGERVGDRNAKKAAQRWQQALAAGLQPPVGAPYNLAENETVMPNLWWCRIYGGAVSFLYGASEVAGHCHWRCRNYGGAVIVGGGACSV